MRTAVVLGIAVLLLLLSACSITVPSAEVDGIYVATYPYGKSTLTLNRDGRFDQRIELKGEEPVVVKGTWTFDPKASAAGFRGIITIDDGAGHLRPDWRTPSTILVEFDVERHWFRIEMETAAEY